MAPRETARESSPPLAASHQLAYDVCDSPHALVVLVDLPGVASEHVSLSLGSQALYLKVSVPTPAPIRDEPRAGVPAGEYEVRVEVPASAYLTGPDTIDASLRNGLLRIRLSKSPGGARRIAIVTGE
jgi:HSP20 family molecular chaperone IbpA